MSIADSLADRRRHVDSRQRWPTVTPADGGGSPPLSPPPSIVDWTE